MREIAAPLVAVGVGVAIAVVLALSPPPKGPLYHWQSDGGYSGVAVPVRAGQVAASTLLDLEAQPNSLELVGVRPLHPREAKGVTIRYGIVTSGHGTEVGGVFGWHPKAWNLRPVAGYVLPPRTQAAVTIGASSKEPGLHAIRGFVIDYRIGRVSFSAPQQMQLDICVAMRQCPSTALAP